MSHDLRSVALSLLKNGLPDLQRRLESGKYVEPGSVLRYVGNYAHDPLMETEPVIFLSAPYLQLKERSREPRGPDDFECMTLVQSMYGHDVGDERESNQVARRMSKFPSKSILHVPQMWCLLIGSSKPLALYAFV